MKHFIVCAFFILISLPHSVFADPESCKNQFTNVTSVDEKLAIDVINPLFDKCSIEIGFNKNLDDKTDNANLLNTEHYRIIHNGQILNATITVTASGPNVITVTISPFYYGDVLFIYGLTYKKKPIVKPFNVPLVNLKKEKKEGIKKFESVMKKSGDRDHSDIYLAGAIDGSHKSKAYYSLNARIGLDSLYKSTNDLLIAGIFLDAKLSSKPKSNPDSLLFGTSATYSWWHSSDYLNWILTNLKIQLEANHKFNVINVPVGQILLQYQNFGYFPLKIDEREKWLSWYFNLLGGVEGGYNCRNPLEEAEGRGIARALTQAELKVVLKPEIVKKVLKDITVDGSAIRRWPLAKEISSKFDEQGNIQILSFNTHPRDYLTAKITFDVNDFFGFFAEYDYGRLPPEFNLVDSRYQIGLLFKTNLKLGL